MKHVNFGIKHIFAKVPRSAKKWGAMLASLSAGIGTIGYIAAIPFYIHLGGICFVLSVVIPFLFGETELKQKVDDESES